MRCYNFMGVFRIRHLHQNHHRGFALSMLSFRYCWELVITMANMALRFCCPWVLYKIFHHASSWVCGKRCPLFTNITLLCLLGIRIYSFVYCQGNSMAISNIIKERVGEIDKKRSLVAPVLRIVTSFTSLVDSADFLEVSWFWISTFSACYIYVASETLFIDLNLITWTEHGSTVVVQLNCD